MLPLRPGERYQEDTGRKGSLGREAVADTGPPRRRDLFADTGLAEALFELDTVNEEELGGICSGHVLLLQEAGPQRLSVSQWGLNFWKRQPWDPLYLIIWGRAQT